MRRMLTLLLTVLILTGCSSQTPEMNRAISLREKLNKGNGCSFVVSISADYGQKVYTFEMECKTDTVGNLCFEVLKPKSISGITGKLSKEGGALTFDDQVLAFEMLADGQITPVSTPWLFVNTLQSGYINACGKNGDGMEIQIDDSYADEALRLSILTGGNDLPVQVQIFWDGRRIVSMDVRDFTIL